jgi:two-component system response regulator VicR
MKILVIDDDPDIVEVVSLGLQQRWPEAMLVAASLGETGINMTKSEAPDIVILDLGLPDMSGFEVLKQVRSFSCVPIIVLTAHGEESAIVEGLDLGADYYIVKPYRLTELVARIRRLTRRRSTAR